MNDIWEALRAAVVSIPDNVELKRREVKAKIERGQLLAETILGVELDAKEELESQMTRLYAEQTALAKQAKYPLFRLDPLLLRDGEGWPELAIYSLDSPKFILSVQWRTNYSYYGEDTYSLATSIRPKLPKILANCYADVVTKLKELASERGETCKFSSRFSGFIPVGVKEKIAAAIWDFDEIFIIAEVGNDEPVDELGLLSMLASWGRPDPLAVGFSLVVGFSGEDLWLIARFNATLMEQALTSGPLPIPELPKLPEALHEPSMGVPHPAKNWKV